MSRRIDWERLKEDYQRGFSLEELAELYGCSPRTIGAKVRKEGWQRSPAERAAANLVKEHLRLWQEVKKRLSAGLNRGDEKELKIAKMAGDVLLSVIKGEREVWQIEPAKEGLTEKELYEVTKKMEQITLSSGAETAVD